MTDLVVLADDLSGAAESAAQALSRTTRVEVWLNARGDSRCAEPAEVVCVDTDSRWCTADEAAARALRGLGTPPPHQVVKKVDSLLRGNIGAEVTVLAAALDAVPVVATALPVSDRVVRDGVPLVAGLPLRESGLWAAERRPAPRSVVDAVAPLPGRVVPQHVVAAGVDATVATMREVVRAGFAPVCDGSTEHDLDTVATAATRAFDRPLLVGSAAMVGAALRLLPHRAPPRRAATPPHSRAVLVVIGSAAPALRAQLALLQRICDAAVLLDPQALVTDPVATAGAVRARVGTARVALVAVDPSAPVVGDDADAICDALVDTVLPLAPRYDTVVTAGGQTAHTLLGRLHVDCLHPLEEITPGAVLSRTSADRHVVTRPGSFGSDDSLGRIVERLLPDLASSAKEIP